MQKLSINRFKPCISIGNLKTESTALIQHKTTLREAVGLCSLATDAVKISLDRSSPLYDVDQQRHNGE
jgi:hypothetical protein